MPRSKDLDTVAPDDPIVVTPPPQPVVKPIVKQPAKSPVAPPTPPVVTPDAGFVDISPLAEKVYDIFGHTKTPFSAALVFPKVFSFAEQNDGETILLALRSHWFTNISWIVTLAFMLFVPSLLRFVPVFGLDMGLQFIMVFCWYLIAFAFALEKFLSWYFDVSIVTDRRVVDIDFNNLLDKKYSEAELGRIQDVSSRVAGVSQTFFDYGTVLIQTAAEQNVIVFEKVPHPAKITKLLQDLRQAELVKYHGNDGGTN